MDKNNIKYGLCNVHYALITGTSITTGIYTYGTPVALAGAVNLSLEADGETIPLYGDNVEITSLVLNKGYTGELELLLANDQFRVDVLGEELVDGVLHENANARPKEFALAFQFEGDVYEKRYWLYRCKCTRPTIASGTTGDSIEPVNDTLSITVRPRVSDKEIKASCENTTENIAKYDTWFSAVYEKSTEAGA